MTANESCRYDVIITQPTFNCSKLTIKTPERHPWHRSGVFLLNVEHISHLVFSVSIVNFEQVIAAWTIVDYLIKHGMTTRDF